MTVIVGAAEGAMAHASPYADASSPTPTAKMTRMRHTMLADGATQVVLHFAHWTEFETRFSSGANATQSLAVKATVEVVGGGTSSATRGAISAQQTLTLAPGDTATLTFTLPAPVAKGGYFYSNTYATAPTAGGQAQIPRGSALSVARAEGWEVNGTDKTLTGTVTAPADGAQAAYGPVRIDAVVPGPAVRSVALVGDSIAASRDSFLQQALAGQPHVAVPVPGDAAYQFARSAEHAHRLALIDACDIALCQYGANDATAVGGGTVAATWVPSAVAVWQLLGKSGTRPVWQTTTTPHTTSSDGFTTTAGQAATSYTPLIVTWNDWLRAGAPLTSGLAYAAPGTSGALTAGQVGHPLRGVMEVADAAETARDSGLWRSTGGAWTADGLHPTDLGKADIAAGISIAPLLTTPAGVLSIRYGGVVRTISQIRYGGVVRTGTWRANTA